MLSKSFGFILLVVLAFASVPAQKTPDEKKTLPQSFSFAFGGGESFLGIHPAEISKENFGKYGLPGVRGVAVTKVEENSPAAKAGIQANDVIIKFDGEEVTSVRKLSRLIGEVAPDHKATIKVLRNGQEMEFTATLERRKFEPFGGAYTLQTPMPNIEMPKMPGFETAPLGALTLKREGQNMFYFGASRQIGIGVSSLTKQLGEYFGVPDGKGLLITGVRENGPAAKAGLKAGDVIIEADGKEVNNNSDLVRAIVGKKEGDVTLTIVRDKNRQTVRVTPEEVKEDFTPFVEGAVPAVQMPKLPTMPVNVVKPLPVPKVIL